MIRNLKAFGLVLVAALALSGVAASAAFAESTTHEFTAASYPVTIYGESAAGDEDFTTEGGKVECKASFLGTASEGSQTVTVHPTYTGCTAFGFLEATVNTEECNYKFNLTTKSGEEYLAHVDVVCPTGQSIKITASTCAAEVKAQTGLTHVGMTNMIQTPTSANDVTVTATAEKIKYTVTKDGFLCPFGGTGNKEDGKYNSNKAVTIRGKSHGGAAVSVDIGATP